MEKECTSCGYIKPLAEFSKDRSRSDGYCYRCKDCDREYRTNLNLNPMNNQTNDSENNLNGTNERVNNQNGLPMIRPKNVTELHFFQMNEQAQQTVHFLKARIAELESRFWEEKQQVEQRIRTLRDKKDRKIRKLKERLFEKSIENKSQQADFDLYQKQAESEESGGLAGFGEKLLDNEGVKMAISALGGALVSRFISKDTPTGHKYGPIAALSKTHEFVIHNLSDLNELQVGFIAMKMKDENFLSEWRNYNKQKSEQASQKKAASANGGIKPDPQDKSNRETI